MQASFNSRFIRGVTSISIGTLLQMALGFLGLMIAVRFVPKEHFGIFVLIQVTSILFMGLVSLAVQNVAVTKFIASANGETKKEIANTSLSYYLLFSLLIGLAILLSIPVIRIISKSSQLNRLLFYTPLFILLNGIYELCLNILQGFHKYKEIALCQIINGITKIIFIFTFLVIMKLSFLGLILAFYLAFIVSIVYQLLAMPYKIGLYFNSNMFRKIFKFGYPLGLNQLVTIMFTKIDRFMIGTIINPTGVANYEIASRIPDNGGRVLQSFNSVFFPNVSELLAKKKTKEAESVVNNSIRLINFLSGFLVLGAFLFKKDIVRLLFSEQYLPSSVAFSILMLSMSVYFCNYLLGGTIIALGKPDKPVKINIIAVIINICGNLILIPAYGITGAAYAALGAQVITNPLFIFFLKKNGIRVLMGKYLKPLAAFTVCVIPYFVFQVSSAIQKVFLLLLYLIICVRCSIISKGDISKIFRALNHQAESGAISKEVV